MSLSEFKIGERIVYPSHGVGEIVNVDNQILAGINTKVYVISFSQAKMTLTVPVNRATISGLRKLVDKNDLAEIYSTLQGKAKQGNRMWSRRAQEYESKINSGKPSNIAEVVRDLYKNVDSNRSYSEITIYELALERLAGELAILENITLDEAINKIVVVLKDKIAA